MKNIIYLFIMGFAGLLVSCANVPPAELINARESYQQASMNQNAQLNPVALHKAEESLNIAEKSYKDDPNSYKTKDLSYVADRKAKTAEALGTTAAENAKTVQANKDFQTTQTEILKNTKGNLATEQQAHLDADNRAAKAQADLAALAAVKEDARGLVITLSGSVLFASDKSELLPAARDKLNQVADALLATKERKLSVDGYTDSQGSASYNMDLSQRRADAVRSYLISRGYPGELIQANGLGKGDPVADNSSPEGRADNRRVEIIVNHATVSQK
jgi:outer membrane protein OmpA-like peptidoglycan-associated protein